MLQFAQIWKQKVINTGIKSKSKLYIYSHECTLNYRSNNYWLDDYKIQYSAFLRLLESALYGDKIHCSKNVQLWLWLILGNVGTGFWKAAQDIYNTVWLKNKCSKSIQQNQRYPLYLFHTFFFLFHELASMLPTKKLEAARYTCSFLWSHQRLYIIISHIYWMTSFTCRRM